nr:hypothetical protein Iba_chr10cCG0620 [Ipomoea batatas]
MQEVKEAGQAEKLQIAPFGLGRLLDLIKLFCNDDRVGLGDGVPGGVLAVHRLGPCLAFASGVGPVDGSVGAAACRETAFGLECPAWVSIALGSTPTPTDSLALLLEPPLTMFSIDEAASLACSCFKIMSL